MKFIIALLFTFNVLVGYASSIVITDTDAPKFTVLLNDWQNTKVDIAIYTRSYELVYRDELDAGVTNEIVYNLKSLESGEYVVVLENEFKKSKEVLSLTQESIAKVSEETFFKPTFRKEDNKIAVNFLALGNDVNIEIHNGRETIYTELVQNTESFGRIFDVEQLRAGNYWLRVGNGEVSQTYKFKK